MRDAITSLLALVVGLSFVFWFYSGDASSSLLRNFQNFMAGEGFRASAPTQWRSVKQIDPMTDEVIHRAVRRSINYPVKTEMTASCKSGSLRIEFVFFDARDNSGWELQRPADVDIFQQAKDIALGLDSFDFVHYGRRVGSAEAEWNRLIPRYRNAITDSKFKGLELERGESILYEFTLEGGVKQVVKIHPDDPGISDVAIDCELLKVPMTGKQSDSASPRFR